MGKTRRLILLLVMLAATAVLCLAGCAAQKYQVDYDGAKFAYRGAKDSYRAGQEVTLYYELIATDTDYAFYLNGEPLPFEYVDYVFKITFTMPAEDVVLSCKAENSMTYVEPLPEGPDVLLMDYYRAVNGTADGDAYYELALYTTVDPGQHLLNEYIGTEEGETLTSYLVSAYAWEYALEVAEEMGLSYWAEREDLVSMDGMLTVVKYRDEDGTYIRVSSDEMPVDGEKAMDAVGDALKAFLTDTYRLKEPEEPGME